MGRKRNADSGAKGNDPTCPAGHNLKRRVADGDYECDSCAGDLTAGSCFYGCQPCDYSLCGGCYVKLATGTLEEKKAQEETPSAAPGPAVANQIDADVADLCDHYSIEDRIMRLLNDAMKERQSTFSGDMQGLWEALSSARSPAGLLMAKLKHMKEGSFVGKVEPPPEVKRIVKQFRLDDDARTKLTDFILKRPNTAKDDLWEIERRLENCGRPSAVVMTMIVAIQRGGKLPDLRVAAPHRDYGDLRGPGAAPGAKEKAQKDRDKERDKDREKDQDKDRDKDREKDRDKERDRKRSRSRDKRSRSRKKRSRS